MLLGEFMEGEAFLLPDGTPLLTSQPVSDSRRGNDSESIADFFGSLCGITNLKLLGANNDSAKALTVASLGVVGCDDFSVFPLHGKLLNVSEARYDQIMKNEETQNIKKIMGLQHNKDYSDVRVGSSRYSQLMIMTDEVRCSIFTMACARTTTVRTSKAFSSIFGSLLPVSVASSSILYLARKSRTIVRNGCGNSQYPAPTLITTRTRFPIPISSTRNSFSSRCRQCSLDPVDSKPHSRREQTLIRDS
ncbi:DNA topoisomerase [Lactarius sanguifluus]|nr:DNA topoisomerase [Lactarius sanguifluus]